MYTYCVYRVYGLLVLMTNTSSPILYGLRGHEPPLQRLEFPEIFEARYAVHFHGVTGGAGGRGSYSLPWSARLPSLSLAFLPLPYASSLQACHWLLLLCSVLALLSISRDHDSSSSIYFLSKPNVAVSRALHRGSTRIWTCASEVSDPK